MGNKYKEVGEMRQTHRLVVFFALIVCFAAMLGAMSVYAGEVPGLSDVISGQEQKTNENKTNDNRTTPAPSKSNEYTGGLVDAGGLSGSDLQGYTQYGQNVEAQNAVQSALGQFMGWLVPILVGCITAALTVRILLDLLYLTAPFIRHKMAPNAAGMGMETQGGMDMQQGMGMQGNMGMQQGGMGTQGGYGTRYGRRSGYGNQQQPQPQTGGRQWVSESAIQAIMASQQPGPNGKPQNVYVVYGKSMVVPLVLVPVMLVLLLSGALTQVGFYAGDMLSGAIKSKVN